jgi:adenosylmethionine-8-amino-7-oxononanoate aminotransferase
MTLSEKDTQYIWHPFTNQVNEPPSITIMKGEGALLYDEHGKEYIDGISSWWVNLHGHAHPYIAQKVSEQLNTLEHVIFAGFTHEPAILLAERLLAILPGDQSKIFYSDNGSTAVEVALKMAVQYHYNEGKPRKKIIAFKNAYHGDTFGAMSIGGRGGFNVPFEPLLFDVVFIDITSGSSSDPIDEGLEILLKNNDIAAFIFEPQVQGSAGMKMYEPEAMGPILELCRKYNVITIADEVMTGFGRTGQLFASAEFSIHADILCLSKGITGGTMALGVTTCNEKIHSAFLSPDKLKTFYHGHSYTANPIACSAALASLDLLLTEDCTNNRKRIEANHRGFINKYTGHQLLKNLRLKGTILAFEVQTNENDDYFNSISRLKHKFVEKGIILRPLGNTIYIMPPYCTTDAQLQKIYDVVADVLNL